MKHLLEHKFWGKSVSEFLDWLKSKSQKYWVILDTETTGLPNDAYEVQLTQVSCIVVKYNFKENTFDEVAHFDKKIKLTQKTIDLMKGGTERIKKVLSFNHYGQQGIIYHEEEKILQDLFDFISEYDDPILVIQNAEFDMRFLNIRHNFLKFKNEVLDTKQVIQLFYLPLIQKLSETDEYYENLVKRIGNGGRDSNLISSSMGKIGPALGINMTGYHDALADCRLTVEMFRIIINTLEKHKKVDIKKYQFDRIKTKRQ